MIIEGLTKTERALDQNLAAAPEAEDAQVAEFLHNIVREFARVDGSDTNAPSRVHGRDGNSVASDGGAEMPALLTPPARPSWKRALDLALVLLTLPLWLPVMLLIALWVGATSPGPIFYRQPRIGYRGRRFMIVKFRTMKVNAETTTHERYLEHLMVADCPMVKLDSRGDPRLVPGGKILRATGLDELPQIFNILSGDMSLVGPRPCTVREFERYTMAQRARANSYPGVTGFWQVNGKNQTTFREMIEMDIYYSRHVSLSLDVRIMLRTLPAIVDQVRDSWQRVPRGAERRAPSTQT